MTCTTFPKFLIFQDERETSKILFFPPLFVISCPFNYPKNNQWRNRYKKEDLIWNNEIFTGEIRWRDLLERSSYRCYFGSAEIREDCSADWHPRGSWQPKARAIGMPISKKLCTPWYEMSNYNHSHVPWWEFNHWNCSSLAGIHGRVYFSCWSYNLK